ncbi:hypothetical protein QEZ54_22265 [Catellatospora sp. KI3]|uniref:hypothetical protein n=1 Tax=Catellatospora sp. KI3 TaxID=3041620 RepID=UPI002482D4A6|nr:hypothetical protein [Catellatospora sp. KI3]MDI1463712.1 hypothetical protein [Catellatospora sp. KI3]
MLSWDADLADIMRRHRSDIAYFQRETSLWRVTREGPATNMCEGESEAEFSVIPNDAPVACGSVLARIADGELDWLDVLVGNVAERDAYLVHRWLYGRLDHARHVSDRIALEERR